ncbi:MAG: C10 family peptidase [Sedimentisphaerales bacterium]|nr:C10 family peptidase [Sedimentisphaerales bacterium]
MVEPIIGFSNEGRYDTLNNNPLVTLVTQDIPNRNYSAKFTEDYQLLSIDSQTTETQNKWNHLITQGHIEETGFELMGLSTSSVADIRVDPMIKSKWSQINSCWSNPVPCYNYFSPKQYPSGCVATAMAQLMRYHKYPIESIDNNTYRIIVDGHLWPVNPVRGSLIDYAYDWDIMPLDPNCTTTQAQRREIGALCYDAGISIGTNYYSEISVADVYNVKDALKNVFKYGQAISGYNDSKNIGHGLINMINPNLDAGDPVILTIHRENGGHAVLCDGYGYYSDTMYHHLNMGWAGISDAWYNLPDVNAIDCTYTSIMMCIYNIHITDEGDGEVISGRVLDHNGKPIADANVYAETLDKQTIISTSTNEKGIYAFDCLNSATTYSISAFAPGLIFTDQEITTGTSSNNKPVSGNIWAVDFTGDYAGDFDEDGDIDYEDFAIFALSWQSTPKDKNWTPSCDLSNPPDNIIDSLDLNIFIDSWLAYSK